MARNRIIKVEFWADEKIGSCSPTAQLLFIGSWNFADDSGVCRANNVYLRNNILPYSSITVKQIEESLNQLEQKGLIFIGDSGGEKYLLIKNFEKHQQINRPSTFRYITENYQDIFKAQGVLSEGSLLKVKGKGKVKEKENVLGEFKNIFLSNEDLKKVRDIYGNKFNDAIEKLSSYIASRSKKYDSHYAVLGKHNWVYKEFFPNGNPQEEIKQKEAESRKKAKALINKIKSKNQAIKYIVSSYSSDICTCRESNVYKMPDVEELISKYQVSKREILEEYRRA